MLCYMHASATKPGHVSRLKHYYTLWCNCIFLPSYGRDRILARCISYQLCKLRCVVHSLYPLVATLLMGHTAKHCFGDLCGEHWGLNKHACGCNATIVRETDGVTVCLWLSCSGACPPGRGEKRGRGDSHMRCHTPHLTSAAAGDGARAQPVYTTGKMLTVH